MPQLTAATWVRIGSALIALAASNLSTAMRSATQAPEIAAVRVPPSAWMTSQSTMIWRSPSAFRSTTARSERPISRWISWVRPDCLPLAASRLPRVWVARGSMPYSAVTQPWPLPRRNGGHLVLDRGGDQHARVAEADQAGAFGMAGEAGFEAKLAHLVGGASGRAHRANLLILVRACP